MLNADEESDEKPFFAERAPQGKASCKKCKQKCLKGDLRIAKLVHNMFGGSEKIKQWYHPACIFEAFLKQRPNTKRIDGSEDIGNWENLSSDDQNEIWNRIDECEKFFAEKTNKKFIPKDRTKQAISKKNQIDKINEIVSDTISFANHKDNTFREFRKLCANITNVSSYLEKTAFVREMFTKGSDGNGFKGNLTQWCRLLLPASLKRVYNLQSKQLIKLFSKIFNCYQEDMLEHLEEGDVSETIQHFYENNKTIPIPNKSLLTLNEVEEWLDKLSGMSKEDEQAYHLETITRKCTPNDLKIIIRLIKNDLRINAGPKHILEAIHPEAYRAFQASNNLDAVVNRFLNKKADKSSKISLMTPIRPMLAEACKSIEQAMQKCPDGMYSEIKYDGERVQLHKQGDEFKFFSRSLKPVTPYKVKELKDFIPKAFPHGEDLILDCEILMIDNNSGKPLPFGSLGVHKQTEFTNANVCLFVFDCTYYNGDDLTNYSIKKRKKILNKNMVEVKNHVMFSEMKFLTNASDLAKMIVRTFEEGLEGLVLKNINSVYEPGKRHWLKIKKDYLYDGSMADSADLVVLGAWYGTGKKGGMMSVFLMGCYDERTKKWYTVTKVHTGHDDVTLDRLQTELDLKMIKISGDINRVPNSLRINKGMIPDFICKYPEEQPVWEITGAEFSKAEIHTADGISIRFPRVTKIREDKDWKTATNLSELNKLYETSKSSSGSLFSKLHEYFDKEDPTNSQTKKRINENSDSGSDSPKKIKTESNEEYFKNNQKLIKPFKTEIETNKMKFKNKLITKHPKSNGFIEYKPMKPLPNIFDSLKLIFAPSISENSKSVLSRHFVAFGGKVLKLDKKMQATHVLHSKSTVKVNESLNLYPKNARHVVERWLYDCINFKKVLDVKKYCVFLK